MTHDEWFSPSRPCKQVGVYGWRKRCLYALILMLLAIVIINFALTLWIIKTMEFNTNGMGELWIVPNGVQLSGKAYVLGSMFSSDIRSHPQKSITFEDAYNVTINIRNESGHLTNSLCVDSNRIYTNSTQFNINDLDGKSLFEVNKDDLFIGAERLRVTGIADFKGSVQTPLVQSCDGSDLSLKSPSRQLHIAAARRITIQTKKDLSTSSLYNIRMHTSSGEVHLKSQNLYMTKLKNITGEPLLPLKNLEPQIFKATNRTSGTQRKIFQVCICNNGKVFIALQDGTCATDQNNKECS